MAEAYDFLIRLGLGVLELEEENVALLMLILTNINLIEENQFIVRHAHEALVIIKRLKNLALTLNNHLASGRSVKEELLLEVRDIEAFEIFFLDE